MQSDALPIPSLEEFVDLPASAIAPLIQNKAVVFSPGGSSRWYFLEQGDVSKGYNQRELYHHYVQTSLQRTFEIAQMMFDDGLRTLFLIGIMPGQTQRDSEYQQNLGTGIAYTTSAFAQQFYDEQEIGVLFRGAWDTLFNQLDINHLQQECAELEARTVHRTKWIIWLTREEVIPPQIANCLLTHLQATGQLPDSTTLAREYYAGRPLQHVDIYIGHNKPALDDQIPPLTTMGDLYFSLAPSYYLNRRLWRHILYDHLYARRGNKRDYNQYTPDTITELQSFVHANQYQALGLGRYHDLTQTWRPTLSGN